MQQSGREAARPRGRRWLDYRLALATVSGILMVLVFPNFNLWPLALIALIPLLAAIDGVRGRRAFGLGLWMGVITFGGSLSWIEYTLVRFGGMPIALAYPVLGLLAGYLALFPALTCLLMQRTAPLRWPAPLRLAVFWTATEGLRGYLLTGFPWNLLGHSLHSQLHLLQLADIGGVYGLSFALALVNGALYQALRAETRRERVAGLSAAGVLLVGWWIYGAARLAEPMPTSTVRLALIQHNAAQDHKWDAAFRQEIVEKLLNLSASTIQQRPDLLVWPEGATPFRFRASPLYRKIIGEFAVVSETPILLGAPDKDSTLDRHYNSAFLIDTTGDIAGQYSKMQLVPFGEYVPLEKILFFVEKMADIGGNFYPGESYTLFNLGKHRFSVFICFESAFGEIVRHFARRGAQFLVTITNDAWFGDTAGTSQHLSFLPFRAVETRRPVAQAAQSGYTALVDQKGALVAHTELLVPATLVVDLHPAEDGTWTVYMLLGNWVVFLSWALAFVWAWSARRAR